MIKNCKRSPENSQEVLELDHRTQEVLGLDPRTQEVLELDHRPQEALELDHLDLGSSRRIMTKPTYSMSLRLACRSHSWIRPEGLSELHR